MSKKLKRRIRSLCLAIQICCILIGSGLDMAVLCHAEDGHAEIEAANADGCTKSHDDHHAEGNDTQLAPTDDCGDCVDVPLSIGRATAQKKPCQENTATSIDLATPSDCTVDSTAHKLLPELVLPPPYIGPLSSIVLLI